MGSISHILKIPGAKLKKAIEGKYNITVPIIAPLTLFSASNQLLKSTPKNLKVNMAIQNPAKKNEILLLNPNVSQNKNGKDMIKLIRNAVVYKRIYVKISFSICNFMSRVETNWVFLMTNG